MPIIVWIKTLIALIIFDVTTTIPAKIEIYILETKLKYKEWIYKKIYEDRSIFFIILYIPKLVLNRCMDKLTAKRMGVSVEEFYQRQTEKLVTEAEKMRRENHKKLTEVMTEFVNTVPGANTHEFYEYLEELPLLSLRFLINSILNPFKDRD